MSWCRWSSICENGFSSDLYIYDSDSSIAVHIVPSRWVGEDQAPPLPVFTECSVDEWAEASARRTEWYHQATREPLTLPHAGETFVFDPDDKEGLTLFLVKLRDIGYNFPDYIWEYIEDECK